MRRHSGLFLLLAAIVLAVVAAAKIELSDDLEYRGYRERRGYSSDVSLNESFFKMPLTRIELK